MSDEAVNRAAKRVASASRCLDAASDDLREAARRRGLLVNGAAAVLEQEAEKLQTFSRVIERLEETAA